MSQNLNHAPESKELNPKDVSKISELVTSLYISNKEQKKAQKQLSEQQNQSNDLSNEYENTNKWGQN